MYGHSHQVWGSENAHCHATYVVSFICQMNSINFQVHKLCSLLLSYSLIATYCRLFQFRCIILGDASWSTKKANPTWRKTTINIIWRAKESIAFIFGLSQVYVIMFYNTKLVHICKGKDAFLEKRDHILVLHGSLLMYLSIASLHVCLSYAKSLEAQCTLHAHI